MELLMKELGLEEFDKEYDHLLYLLEKEESQKRNFFWGSLLGAVGLFGLGLLLKKKNIL